MVYLLAVLLAYLVGSFPSGVVVVRIARGMDVRRVGSRRSGATNVLRAAGVLSALIVLLLDVLKGAGAVWLGQWLASSWVGEHWLAWTGWAVVWPLPAEALSSLWGGLLCGLAAIAGHNWPVYIRFQGGRGVATSLGTLIPLAPVVAAGGFLVGVAVIALSRYVSLGSVTGAGVVPLGLLLQALVIPFSLSDFLPLFLYGLLIAGLVIFQHHDNIARLRAGTERKLGQKAEPPPGKEG